jgi:hypothetical protein
MLDILEERFAYRAGGMDLLREHWHARRRHLHGKLKAIDAALSALGDGPGKAVPRTAMLAERNRVAAQILELDELIGQERRSPAPDYE